MRIPRWLPVSLIAVSAIALVAVPAWLWVELPHRTAEKFVAAIDAGNVEVANRLVTGATIVLDKKHPTYIDDRTLNLVHSRVRVERRSIHDYVGGRQRLSVLMPNGNPLGITFTATANSVESDPGSLPTRINSHKARMGSQLSSPNP